MKDVESLCAPAHRFYQLSAIHYQLASLPLPIRSIPDMPALISACFRAFVALQEFMVPHRFRLQAPRVIFSAVLAALFLTVTTGYSFTAVYSFGDSLTDTGRNPPSPGTNYFNGRYSNGPLWVEYLSAQLGIPYDASNNLAFSGSETSNLLSQIAAMPASGNPQSALYTVWSGGNDFLDAVSTDLIFDSAWAVTISNAVRNLTNAVATLYTNGAREVIVGNMPNVGQTPGASSYGSLTNYVDSKVQLFNTSLGTAVTNLMFIHPGLRIYLMNANQLGTNVTDSPATYGFTVVSIGALQDTTLTNKSFNGPGADYLYWDQIHPTTKLHALVAALAYDLVGVGLNLAGTAPTLNLTVSNLYPGFQYSIQGSSNLFTWTNYQTFTASGTNLSLHVTNGPGPAAFYRVIY